MTIPPAFDPNAAAVFLACSEQYMPHTLAAVASIMAHADPDKRYDIVVLTDNVPQEKTEQAGAWFARHPNAALRFFDIGSKLDAFGRDAFHVTSRYPLSIYFRFFAPSLFSQYDRIVYLDSDMIALSDIATLFAEDLRGNILGACRDVMFEEEFRANRGTPAAAYPENILGLTPEDGYFNTGTLLLDLNAMRSQHIQEKLFETLKTIDSPSLPDQDIFNAVCKGRVHFLDIAWNLHDWMADPAETCTKFHFAREETKEFCRHSRQRRNILHFSEQKPWRNAYSGSLGGEYWRHAAQTPLYQDALSAWRAANRPGAFLREAARCLFHLARCGIAYAVGTRTARVRNARRFYDYWDTLRAVARNFRRDAPDCSRSSLYTE